jgi:hypothetical protein
MRDENERYHEAAAHANRLDPDCPRITPASRWMRRAWKAALERLARAGGLSA